jgi:hypothetical protein
MTKEDFAPRRQGAMKTHESKHRVSALSLSGFAPLREISVKQVRPAFAQGYGLARAGLQGKPAEKEKK